MDLNRATLIGNLTRDPEVRTIPSGQSVANFSIATNRFFFFFTGNRQTAVEYHNIVAWGKLADICSQYLKRGKKIYIEGRLQTRDWEGKDGVKRTRTEIVGENMIMLDGGSRTGERSATAAPHPAQDATEPTLEPISEATAQPNLSAQAGKDEEIKVEDIPF